MNQLLLHPRTKALLGHIAVDPPQSLLFSGPEGTGKRSIAQHWLQSSLGVAPAAIHITEPLEKNSITVEQIRGLYRATRTKQTQKQFYIIDKAGTMSAGAQNAFLKLLEEPNSAIHFILTASAPEELLPTIRSRTQHVAVSPVPDAQLLEHLQANYSLEPGTRQQIAFIARGRVGLATTLATDPAALTEYRQLATRAKELLDSSTFERLALFASLSDRQQTITFLTLTANMASTLLLRATASQEQALWVRRIAALHDTLERLDANANLKIQLTRLALTL